LIEKKKVLQSEGGTTKGAHEILSKRANWRTEGEFPVQNSLGLTPVTAPTKTKKLLGGGLLLQGGSGRKGSKKKHKWPFSLFQGGREMSCGKKSYLCWKSPEHDETGRTEEKKGAHLRSIRGEVEKRRRLNHGKKKRHVPNYGTELNELKRVVEQPVRV